MQKDMHYYAVYVLARAAGIKKTAAFTIASASQFVDESINDGESHFTDGSTIKHIATAHHFLSISNRKSYDQKFIWIPFHFLPGGFGESNEEKMICAKNSLIAKSMTNNALNYQKKDFPLELLGITSHVYMDTFSHYGFSGMGSSQNKIKNHSIDIRIKNQTISKYVKYKSKLFSIKRFFESISDFCRGIISFSIEVGYGPVGHGVVYTLPDKPYLEWGFKYEKKSWNNEALVDIRDNKVTFMEACKEIFDLYKKYANRHSYLKDEKIHASFAEIEDGIKDILSKEGKKVERAEIWEKYFRENILFDTGNEVIPQYPGEEWRSILIEKDVKYKNHTVYNFFEAAKYHQNYVLNELLPKNKIKVV